MPKSFSELCIPFFIQIIVKFLQLPLFFKKVVCVICLGFQYESNWANGSPKIAITYLWDNDIGISFPLIYIKPGISILNSENTPSIFSFFHETKPLIQLIYQIWIRKYDYGANFKFSKFVMLIYFQ